MRVERHADEQAHMGVDAVAPGNSHDRTPGNGVHCSREPRPRSWPGKALKLNPSRTPSVWARALHGARPHQPPPVGRTLTTGRRLGLPGAANQLPGRRLRHHLLPTGPPGAAGGDTDKGEGPPSPVTLLHGARARGLARHTTREFPVSRRARRRLCFR